MNCIFKLMVFYHEFFSLKKHARAFFDKYALAKFYRRYYYAISVLR